MSSVTSSGPPNHDDALLVPETGQSANSFAVVDGSSAASDALLDHSNALDPKTNEKANFRAAIVESKIVVDIKKEKRTCPMCHKLFLNFQNVRRHIKTEHENTDRLHCGTCNKSYSCKPSLDYHIRSKHSENNSYQCKKCGEHFESLGNLAKHKKSHRLTNAACEDCEKTFDTKSNLNRHKKECHRYETRLNLSKTEVFSFPFRCDQCEYVAKRKFHLSRHIKTMHGGNVGGDTPKDKRTCPHCFKLFCNSSKVRRHIKSMHTTEKFNCEICQEKFSSSNALMKHGDSHVTHIVGKMIGAGQDSIDDNVPVDNKGTRGHEEQNVSSSLACYYCEKEILKKHMWRHIAEVHDKTKLNTDKIQVTAYPYHCEQCSFSSKRKFDLKRHVMVTHSLCQVSFFCDTCGKEYRYKGSLDRHAKTHKVLATPD